MEILDLANKFEKSFNLQKKRERNSGPSLKNTQTKGKKENKFKCLKKIENCKKRLNIGTELCVYCKWGPLSLNGC